MDLGVLWKTERQVSRKSARKTPETPSKLWGRKTNRTNIDTSFFFFASHFITNTYILHFIPQKEKKGWYVHDIFLFMISVLQEGYILTNDSYLWLLAVIAGERSRQTPLSPFLGLTVAILKPQQASFRLLFLLFHVDNNITASTLYLY